MIPGTILQTKNIELMVLYKIKDETRIPCVLVSPKPWVSSTGIIDIVTGNQQWYWMPGVVLLEPETLSALPIIDNIDDSTVLAIAHNTTVIMQIIAALHNR